MKGKLGLAGKFNAVRDKQRHLFLFGACEGETRISWEIQCCKRQTTPFVSFGACEGETRIS